MEKKLKELSPYLLEKAKGRKRASQVYVVDESTGEQLLKAVTTRTQWNDNSFPRNVVEGSGAKSMTVPNMVMSIKTIMQRYASGHPLLGLNNPRFEGDAPVLPPNWNQLDISEKMDYVSEYSEKLREHKSKMAEADKKANEDKIVAEYEARVKAEQEALAAKIPAPAPSAGQ